MQSVTYLKELIVLVASASECQPGNAGLHAQMIVQRSGALNANVDVKK
jgi:hypothetical protein